MESSSDQRHPDHDSMYVRRHLRFGWWWLLLSVTLGIVLEAFHGFKVAWYSDVSSETRRLLWRLAHAHSAFLALVNIAFAVTLYVRPRERARGRGLASASLIGAAVALPGGFFLGGMVIYGGDPGLGIFVLPIGAVLLVVGVFVTALSLLTKWI